MASETDYAADINVAPFIEIALSKFCLMQLSHVTEHISGKYNHKTSLLSMSMLVHNDNVQR
jgi:hypothetical protein